MVDVICRACGRTVKVKKNTTRTTTKEKEKHMTKYHSTDGRLYQDCFQD
ncbi:unnamed protein product [Chondrus crispus]|uniref:Uncharacterized protein n=1 Tax=Chondrus crispus TaxID=2769 RepID=R7QS90_CHOCR|nr:unnamed protein product [Chondrus crispus]CDF40598.1 unnamed protein product [Chondrus crispus]|eukprot:XP_005710892.1 unnamed protein product [Chondrus crispus]